MRQHIAYVPQEPLLFHRTVCYIAYGLPMPSEEETMQAAREANALEFIEKLPRGLDTQVGERGVSSGRAAPAYRHRARHPHGRNDPRARRGNERA